MERVNAQQARRVLDRLVGYKLSPLLWQKVRRGLSAGRVQSATVKLIVDREREIRDFKPQEYWTIQAILTDMQGKHAFEASFFGKGKKKLVPKSKAEVQEILSAVRGQGFSPSQRPRSRRGSARRMRRLRRAPCSRTRRANSALRPSAR
ncbi:MAG: DNA topoisomerase [Christensenellaceae bacterium]